MTLRNRNMTARRERILAAARDIIDREGFDALTTRRLADDAGITVPTLYNLIGSKDEIISELVRRGTFRFQVGLSISTEKRICEQVEALAVLSMHNIARQASYWRALAHAFDQVGGAFVANPLPGKPSSAGDAAIAVALPILERAAAAGQLLGTLPVAVIVEQMVDAFRGPFRDWAVGTISVDEARYRIARGLLMTVAADAGPELRKQLLDRLAHIVVHGVPDIVRERPAPATVLPDQRLGVKDGKEAGEL